MITKNNVFSLISLVLLTGCQFPTGVETNTSSESSSTTGVETNTSSESSSETNSTFIPTTDVPDYITTTGNPVDSETNNNSETSEDSETSDSVCGNLIVEPGEECDGGATGPNPVSRKCNIDCTFSVCGDSKLNPNNEECDDGNKIDGDQCSNECIKPRWVFLTSDYIGLANFGGIKAADLYCQNDAIKFGMPGKYMAWLSEEDGGNSPIYRFESNDFKGWYRLRSPFTTLLAKGWIGLTMFDLLAPINITPNGLLDIQTVSVWTATEPDGERAENSWCDDWTMMNIGSDYQVFVGDPQSSSMSSWSDGLIKSCASRTGSKLYCFQVGE